MNIVPNDTPLLGEPAIASAPATSPAATPAEDDHDAVSLLDRGWVLFPSLFALLAVGIFLVALVRPEHDQQGLAILLVLAPYVFAFFAATLLRKRRKSRAPAVFFPFTGAAPAELPPVEALGPDAISIIALIERSAALDARGWNEVLRPIRKGYQGLKLEAAQRAVARAEAALGVEREPAKAALAAHVRSAFAAESATADMLAPSFVYAAGLGLLARDALSGDELRALYEPMEPVIPLSSLPISKDRLGRGRRVTFGVGR